MHHLRSMFLLIAVATFQLALADVATSKFQVHIPTNLTVPGGYDHRDALVRQVNASADQHVSLTSSQFGIPPYGGKIQQKVYYTNSTLCETPINKKSGYPVVQATDPQTGLSVAGAWESPFILMVDRGDCTFVQKVRNAQRAGAAAVLIADNVCMCFHAEGECEMPVGQNMCEEIEPIMADDGSGADISIPSFLLFKPDADQIKKTLVANQQMQAELSFSVPAPDSRVEYELWTSPIDNLSRDFVQSFEQAAVSLGSKAYFTPHMFIYDGSKIGCDSFLSSCGGLCTNEGRYCAIGPEDSDILGRDIVTESLRQMCIWELYGKENGVGTEWWTYVREFLNSCANPEQLRGFFKSDECIGAAMKVAGVDNAKVNQCMADSGGVEGDVVNTQLESAIGAKAKSGAVVLPSLFVNNGPIRGELVFRNVFEALCAGYAQGSSPPICEQCQHCADPEECVATNGKCSSGGDSAAGSVSAGEFFLSMLGLSLLFIAVGYIVYTRQQHYMRNQIRGIMAEYMPIDPSKQDNGIVSAEDDGEIL